jgi:N-[(2S)-2-amino-2-carboxyethyl]-L-glutamate dehydrogenase
MSATARPLESSQLPASSAEHHRPPDFAVVTGPTAHRVIHGDLPRCQAVVADAYLAHGAGRTVCPHSQFLRFPDTPDARIIALPAHVGAPFQVSGIKWVASYPANVATGRPRASAVVVLNDPVTGYPFACLEGSVISAARTAASAALAADYLMPGDRHAPTIGFVGTGVIARYVYQFLIAGGWRLDKVLVHDRNPAAAAGFSQACEDGCYRRVEVCAKADELVRQSDLVVFATTASSPYLADVSLLAHNPAVLHLSLRDLAAPMMLAARNIVDDPAHALREGTSLELAARLTGVSDVVAGTLFDLLTGRLKLDPSEPRIFSPFGLGVLDVALGMHVYRRAAERGALTPVSDFFYDEWAAGRGDHPDVLNHPDDRS